MFLGYKSLLVDIALPANTIEATALWPSTWITSQGSSMTRREGAPLSAIILPVQCIDATGALVPFNLQTQVGTNPIIPFEVVNPNLLLPAFVTRWSSMELEVGANLWAYNTAAAVATITVWFYYKTSTTDCPSGVGLVAGMHF